MIEVRPIHSVLAATNRSPVSHGLERGPLRTHGDRVLGGDLLGCVSSTILRRSRTLRYEAGRTA